MTGAIDRSDRQAQAVPVAARHRLVTQTDLTAAVDCGLLSQRDEAFETAAQRGLEKNREPVRRLG